MIGEVPITTSPRGVASYTPIPRLQVNGTGSGDSRHKCCQNSWGAINKHLQIRRSRRGRKLGQRTNVLFVKNKILILYIFQITHLRHFGVF